VTCGEDEPVAIEPSRISGIEAQMPCPEDISGSRHTDRHTWMAGLGLLDAVGGKETNGLDAKLIHL